MVLGVGAGDGRELSFTASGEPTDQRTLARRLDEGLAIIDALWTGEPVSFEGHEFSVDGLQLTPMPVQRPRIPIWVGGDWLRPGVRRRLTQWDGCCVYRGTPGGPDDAPMSAQDVRDVVALIVRERGNAAGYDICIGGAERDSDEERERDHIRSLAEAGATWWNEWISPKDVNAMREAIGRGPLRID